MDKHHVNARDLQAIERMRQTLGRVLGIPARELDDEHVAIGFEHLLMLFRDQGGDIASLVKGAQLRK